jgi:hypothetical protein
MQRIAARRLFPLVCSTFVANADASIYGTANGIVIGVDQQGSDWKTAGYWARLRASTFGQYQSWAQAGGVFDSFNTFLAINRDAD